MKNFEPSVSLWKEFEAELGLFDYDGDDLSLLFLFASVYETKGFVEFQDLEDHLSMSRASLYRRLNKLKDDKKIFSKFHDFSARYYFSEEFLNPLNNIKEKGI